MIYDNLLFVITITVFIINCITTTLYSIKIFTLKLNTYTFVD